MHCYLKCPSLLGLMLLILTAPRASRSDSYRHNYPLPQPGVPQSLGVNIHFTQPGPGEMKLLAQEGFKWIRMDFSWGGTEQVKGVYNFSPYDVLMKYLDRYHIRPIFILDYGNDLYQKGSPTTPDSRNAFCSWVAAAMKHFKGQGIVWEMWNEPNGDFWLPHPDVQQYASIALQVGRTIRKVAPEEWFVGPATSGMDLKFMESCFQRGLLKYWDAVSFHPYRDSSPETAAADFRNVRALIARYAPRGKHIPLISSEWGYSELYPGLSVARQARWAVREMLSNMASHIRFSIWYDWHDDGTNPKDPEAHFGTVYYDYRKKPAYIAMQTLAQTLHGYNFNKRLILSSTKDYCLLFSNGKNEKLAVWSTDSSPHQVTIPMSKGDVTIVSMLGDKTTTSAGKNGLKLTISDMPQYIVPSSYNPLLSLGAAWKSVPPVVLYTSHTNLTNDFFSLNTMQKPKRGTVPKATVELYSRIPSPQSSTLELNNQLTETSEIPKNYKIVILPQDDVHISITATLRMASGGPPLVQELKVQPIYPVSLSLQPPMGHMFTVNINNPSGRAIRGELNLYCDNNIDKTLPIKLLQGTYHAAYQIPSNKSINHVFMVSLSSRKIVHVEMPLGLYKSCVPPILFKPLPFFRESAVGSSLSSVGLQVVPDGNPAIGSHIMSSIAIPPVEPGKIKQAVACVTYSFDEGWKFLRISPIKPLHFVGRPVALGEWVYGNGTGNGLRLRFTDSTGQTFQADGGQMDWTGWRYVQFSLTGSDSYWGGADDGTVHYPISLDTLLLVDGLRKASEGTVYLARATLIYPSRL